MKKRTSILAAAAAVILLAGTAIAQPGGMSGGHMGGPGMNMQGQRNPEGDFFQRMLPMMRMLNLTDDQRESVAAIMQETQTAIQNVREANEPGAFREDFLDMFSSSSLSAGQVEALLNQRVDVMKQVNEIVAGALVEIHDILTPEQLQALAEFDPGAMGMGVNGNQGHPGAGMGVHTHR